MYARLKPLGVANQSPAQRALVRLYARMPSEVRPEFLAAIRLLGREFSARLRDAELRDRIGEEVGHA